MNKNVLRNVTIIISASLLITCAVYIANHWFLSSHSTISPTDAFFVEGLVSIILGALLFIGSGGISRTSRGAAMLAATASALGNDVIGPSEIFRRDAWKPKGFLRLGLTLIMTGIILLVIYFASL